MIVKEIVRWGGLPPGREMTVIEHLEEFRIRLIRSVIVVIGLTILAFLCKEFIFTKVILGPSRLDFFTYRFLCSLGTSVCIDQLNFSLQNRSMGGQFYTHMSTSFIIGIVTAVPYVLIELWQYIKPALDVKFRYVIYKVMTAVVFLMVTGLIFGYFVLAPLSIQFLSNYSVDQSILNQFDIDSYLEIVTMLVLGCAAIFQLPVVIYFLTEIGVVKPQLLKKYRKHSFVIILIIAAVITPPDILSQIIATLPLYVLFEISIVISTMVYKKRMKSSKPE